MTSVTSLPGGLASKQETPAFVLLHPGGKKVLDAVQVPRDSRQKLLGEHVVQRLPAREQPALRELAEGAGVQEFQLQAQLLAGAERPLHVLGDPVPQGGVGDVHGAKEIDGRSGVDFPQVGVLQEHKR